MCLFLGGVVDPGEDRAVTEKVLRRKRGKATREKGNE
jgi:hypothetical protein